MIDRFLNAITMYRLVMYSLCFIAFFAVVFGFLGKLPYAGPEIISSAILFSIFCFGINYIFAKFLRAPATIESSLITGLILFCIMAPAQTWYGVWITFLMCLVAIASKYIITYRKKHLVNPVVFSAVIFGFTQYAPTWWVANVYLAWLVILAGVLIIRKTRRFGLAIACIVGFFISYAMTIGFSEMGSSVREVIISWPLLFFVSFMLTEPSTLMPRQKYRIPYGFAVGIAMGSPMQIIGSLHTTPEVVLLIGNIVSFFVGLREKIQMQFQEKKQLSRDAYEFVFIPNRKFNFQAGQYLEWSLPHAQQDLRGIRRYFTIASAPQDDQVKIGIRIGENPSSFKRHLQGLQKGDTMYAGSLDGDFVLPHDEKSLVFIAGGIGVTPFVSMVRKLLRENNMVNAVLFYANKTNDIAYLDLFKEAESSIGLKTIYVLDQHDSFHGDAIERGPITKEMIEKYIPDITNCMVYLSGPNAMVDAYKKLMQSMKVSRFHIKTDYFPGF